MNKHACHIRYKITGLILCALLMLGAFSCQSSSVPETYDFYLYFKDISSDALKKIPADLDESMDIGTKVSSIWGSLKQEMPNSSGFVSPVPKGLEMRSYSLAGEALVLDFPAEYYPEVSSKEELILRSSLVMTFTQLDGITSVEVRTEGNPLIGPEDRVIGAQNSQNFTDALGRQFSDVMTAEAVLYFADETGKALLPRQVEVAYPNTMSLQQALILRLINGPEDTDEAYPVLPTDTKLISVTVKDGICHVNLNNEIINEPMSVSPEVQIYSIVNSLTEIPNISQVLICVNGSSNLFFKDTVNLSSPLLRNLDLIKKRQE